MAMTVEELLARLDAVAARLGTTTESVIEEITARIEDAEDPVDAFVGCAASGLTAPLDIHEVRASAAADKYARGA